MKKRIIFLSYFIFSLSLIYFFDIYLSSSVNNLTTINYACYVYENQNCKNKNDYQQLDMVYKSLNPLSER
jgi:hypothetical protein